MLQDCPQNTKKNSLCYFDKDFFLSATLLIQSNIIRINTDTRIHSEYQLRFLLNLFYISFCSITCGDSSIVTDTVQFDLCTSYDTEISLKQKRKQRENLE